jgi:hypothetical protein
MPIRVFLIGGGDGRRIRPPGVLSILASGRGRLIGHLFARKRRTSRAEGESCIVSSMLERVTPRFQIITTGRRSLKAARCTAYAGRSGEMLGRGAELCIILRRGELDEPCKDSRSYGVRVSTTTSSRTTKVIPMGASSPFSALARGSLSFEPLTVISSLT